MSEKDPVEEFQSLSAKRHRATLKKLLELGDCDICFDSMADRKVYACSNDHWVYERCVSRTECHFCKEDLRRSPPRRCYGVERLVKMVSELED